MRLLILAVAALSILGCDKSQSQDRLQAKYPDQPAAETSRLADYRYKDDAPRHLEQMNIAMLEYATEWRNLRFDISRHGTSEDWRRYIYRPYMVGALFFLDDIDLNKKLTFEDYDFAKLEYLVCKEPTRTDEYIDTRLLRHTLFWAYLHGYVAADRGEFIEYAGLDADGLPEQWLDAEFRRDFKESHYKNVIMLCDPRMESGMIIFERQMEDFR